MTRAALGPLLLGAAAALAASPSPELQSSIRASTFEVVIPKAASDLLSYEKPLPLELIPFVIRNDKYWSMGTAFAIAPDTFVTAAHVLREAIGNQFGPPALRDAAAHVYRIDRILAYSGHEDFVLFSVAGAPAAVALPIAPEHKIDSVVFAVGNALGEGVVIRDGLLTSETPEAQDGRWKWLRFSAAASPGNSGGPLLDADGRVIGIVLAKSPNENLNFALPIGRALEARGKPGSVDIRYSVKAPFLRGSAVATTKAEFKLPASYADFARDYAALRARTAKSDFDKLLAENAAKLFPHGKADKALGTVYQSLTPSFVQQQRDDSWDVPAATDSHTLELPPHGLVTTGTSLGMTTFRLRRPSGALDDAFYADSRASMDLLLKGLDLARPVGSESIRVTSLGAAERDTPFVDHFGRHWQVRSWPLGYADSRMLVFLLPTPEGYVGFVVKERSPEFEATLEALKLMSDYFYVSYSGTLPQWAAYLKRKALRAAVFDAIDIDPAVGHVFSYASPLITVKVPPQVMVTSDESTLLLAMSYFMSGGKLAWDVGSLRLSREENQKTFVSVRRRPKPATNSDQHLEDEWTQISTRAAGYNGSATHDADFKNYWITDVVSAPRPSAPGVDPGAAVLYVIGYGTEASQVPRELAETLAILRGGTQVLER